MEEVWQHAIDNWQWITIVLMLMFSAYMLGSIKEINRVNRWMESHSERLAELWADEMALKELEREDE